MGHKHLQCKLTWWLCFCCCCLLLLYVVCCWYWCCEGKMRCAIGTLRNFVSTRNWYWILRREWCEDGNTSKKKQTYFDISSSVLQNFRNRKGSITLSFSTYLLTINHPSSCMIVLNPDNKLRPTVLLIKRPTPVVNFQKGAFFRILRRMDVFLLFFSSLAYDSLPYSGTYSFHSQNYSILLYCTYY